MFSRRSKIAGAAALGLGLATAAPHALAAEAADAGRFVAVDTIWVLLGAALVFFMQPGFAMVETGLTRAKNAAVIKVAASMVTLSSNCQTRLRTNRMAGLAARPCPS